PPRLRDSYHLPARLSLRRRLPRHLAPVPRHLAPVPRPLAPVPRPLPPAPPGASTLPSHVSRRSPYSRPAPAPSAVGLTQCDIRWVITLPMPHWVNLS